MTAIILDGRPARDEGMKRLRAELSKSEIPPGVAVIQIGDLAESAAYIRQKRLFAERVGVSFKHLRFSADVSAEAVKEAIAGLNADPSIHGILVQLPVPPRLDRRSIIDSIAPAKDVDGLTSANNRLLLSNEKGVSVPATARGILSLLSYYHIPVAGKKAVVIGRSELVGAPTAALMRNRGAIVTVCHSRTENVPEKTRQADILVVAVGKPRLVTKEYVSPGQIVVDVGINLVGGEKLEEEIPKRKLVGDVDFDGVKDIVGAISPVPGGVGPMTVLSLFENLVEIWLRQTERD